MKRLQLLLLLAVAVFALASCSPQSPPASTVTPPRPSTLVLVHGMFADGDQMEALRRPLSAAGYRCHVPTLSPAQGELTIPELARLLALSIETDLPADEPLQLIGHSMGGLVALEYVKHHGGAARTRALYTLATPHQGTSWALLHPGPGAAQMRPNARYLTELHASPPPCPVTTYRSSHDFIILPNSSSILPFATNKLIESPDHNSLLRITTLHEDLSGRVKAIDQEVMARQFLR
ncbi:MAG: alpha/beta fold hydrolase [Verrucomicrobiota bacterium JB023]|nr:alpha/beta fold hydrolase [Verrucomicrobiota bacterium JB023]